MKEKLCKSFVSYPKKLCQKPFCRRPQIASNTRTSDEISWKSAVFGMCAYCKSRTCPPRHESKTVAAVEIGETETIKVTVSQSWRVTQRIQVTILVLNFNNITHERTRAALLNASADRDLFFE